MAEQSQTPKAAVLQSPQPAKDQVRETREVRIYQHSDIVYWWIVWFYSAVCAGLTYAAGNTVEISGKAVLIHPNPWVGISFVLLLLFVLFFTNVRARGANSLLLALAIALGAVGLQYVGAWTAVFERLPQLRIHMNLAFYVMFSLVAFVFWFVGTFVVNRFTYWYFQPGQIGRRVWIGEGGESYVARDIELRRSSDDILVHRILGLWFLGAGTGDLEVRFTTPRGPKVYLFKNVWRVAQKERMIKQLIGAREMMH